MRKTECSKCNGKIEQNRLTAGQRYCLSCHNEYARKTRKPYSDFSTEQKMKSNARAYVNVLIRRGKIQKQLCEVCGESAQMHHDDYSKPLEVRWLCREHHLDIHKVERKKTCSTCGKPKEAKRDYQTLCLSCHAENMRKFRVKKRAEFLAMKELIHRLTA